MRRWFAVFLVLIAVAIALVTVRTASNASATAQSQMLITGSPAPQAIDHQAMDAIVTATAKTAAQITANTSDQYGPTAHVTTSTPANTPANRAEEGPGQLTCFGAPDPPLAMIYGDSGGRAIGTG